MKYDENKLKNAYRVSEEYFLEEVYNQTKAVKPSNMINILEVVDLLQVLNRANLKIESSTFLKNEFLMDTMEYYAGIKIRLMELVGLPNFFDV